MGTLVATNMVFPAAAETVVNWGRSLTEVEQTVIQTKKGEFFAVGKFGSFPLGTNGVYTYPWVSLDVANEWVAYVNTFSPPPDSAVAKELVPSSLSTFWNRLLSR